VRSPPPLCDTLRVMDLSSAPEIDPGEDVSDGKVDDEVDPVPTPFVPDALTRPTRTMQQQVARYGHPVAHIAHFAFITIPRNYRDMRLMKHQDQQKWQKAMQREYDQLVGDHKTWDLRIKPEDEKSILCTWVYAQKKGPKVKADEVKKACVCARSNLQEFCVNSEESFAPFASLIRYLLFLLWPIVRV